MAQDVSRLTGKNGPPPMRPHYPPPGDPPRELHPAAMQAAADYSRAIDEARDLRAENDRLKVELLAEREIRRHFEDKLAERDLAYDRLNAFALEFVTHISTIKNAIATAEARSLEVAKRVPPKPIDDLERDLAAAAEQVVATRTPEAAPARSEGADL